MNKLVRQSTLEFGSLVIPIDLEQGRPDNEIDHDAEWEIPWRYPSTEIALMMR